MASLGQYSALDTRNLIGIWERQYEAAFGGIWAPTIGRLIPSSSATETYDWLGAAPYLTEQLGVTDAAQLPREEALGALASHQLPPERAVRILRW
jgi:hypothetical protein